MLKYKKYFKLVIIFFILILFKSAYNETIQNFLKNNYKIKFDELLGKGGSGEIWGSSSSNIAVKGGKTKRACQIINKEFKIQKKIFNEIIKNNIELSERIKILNPKKIISNIKNKANSKANICAMELPRLYPIKEEPNKNLVTQLRLGEESLDQVEKDVESIIKGHAIGLKETEKIVSNYKKMTSLDNIEQLFADIGTFLGKLHYKIQLDGLDTEVCLVRSTPNAKKYEIFFIDFGMCNNIKYKNNHKKAKSQSKIVEALMVEPIFPNPTNKNFKYFLNAYLKVAKTRGLEKFAHETINKFIEKQYLINQVISNYLINEIKMNKRRIKRARVFAKIILDWSQNKFINQLIKTDYNLPPSKINIMLKNMIPELIKIKSKESKLNNIEKSVLSELKEKVKID